MTDKNTFIEICLPDDVWAELVEIAGVQQISVEDLAAQILTREVAGCKIERIDETQQEVDQ